MTIERFDGAELVASVNTAKSKNRPADLEYVWVELYKCCGGWVVNEQLHYNSYSRENRDYLTVCLTPEDVRTVSPELYDKAFGKDV